MGEYDSTRPALAPLTMLPAESQNESLTHAATEMGPGVLEAAWGRSVRCWQRAGVLVNRWVDWITTGFLSAMVRLRLVSLRKAERSTNWHATALELTESAYHLDLALRLLVVTLYLGTLPLFVFAWLMTAYTHCTDCWFNNITQAYVLIPILGALCGLTRL